MKRALLVVFATLLVGGLSPAFAQAPNPATPGTEFGKGQVGEFDGFLDKAPGVAEELQKNPNLVNDPAYLAKHPNLEEFLNHHSGIAGDLKTNPTAFVQRERIFERFEERHEHAGRGGGEEGRVAGFDQFLDNHQKVAQELNRDPRLVDDPKYLKEHPELAEFLNNHPELKEQIKAHPDRFLAAERRFEKHEGENAGHGGGEEGRVAGFDQFLDSHQKVAQELNRDPRLVDDPKYLKEHPELAEYLNNHPELREQIKAHPDRFRAAERRFEKHEGEEHAEKKHEEEGRELSKLTPEQRKERREKLIEEHRKDKDKN